MAPRISSLFQAISLLLLLIHTTQAKKPDPINQFCKTATHRALCTKMVHNAKTLHDASKSAMEFTLAETKKLQSMTNLIKPAVSHMRPITQQSIEETCQENFEGAVYNLQTSLEALEKNDEGTLLSYLSAATESECSDAFAEMGGKVPPELQKQIDYVFNLVDNCLAVVEQK